MITSLYERGLQSNGAVRYSRAVMLLATQHSREVEIELGFAARYQTPMPPGRECRPADYQWSAVYLLEHLR